MYIEAFCTNCHWVNRAYSRVEDVPSKCPECHEISVDTDVRYRDETRKAEKEIEK